MENLSEITNLIYRYQHILDQPSSHTTTVEEVLQLFAEEGTLSSELLGLSTGKAEIQEALQQQLALEFLEDTKQIPQAPAITLAQDGLSATVLSYSTMYWKCTPVLLTRWQDEVVKTDGKWLFKSRTSTDDQKNFELIGEMQLRGKKSYSERNLNVESS